MADAHPRPAPLRLRAVHIPGPGLWPGDHPDARPEAGDRPGRLPRIHQRGLQVQWGGLRLHPDPFPALLGGSLPVAPDAERPARDPVRDRGPRHPRAPVAERHHGRSAHPSSGGRRPAISMRRGDHRDWGARGSFACGRTGSRSSRAPSRSRMRRHSTPPPSSRATSTIRAVRGRASSPRSTCPTR